MVRGGIESEEAAYLRDLDFYNSLLTGKTGFTVIYMGSDGAAEVGVLQ